MSIPAQAKVIAIQGEAKAIAPDGSVRILKAGDILQAGEQLVLAPNASVQYAMADGTLFQQTGAADPVPVELAAAETAAADPATAAEAEQIIAALRAANFNQTEAARQLGIDRSTLYRKMKRYAIEIGLVKK